MPEGMLLLCWDGGGGRGWLSLVESTAGSILLRKSCLWWPAVVGAGPEAADCP